MAEETAKVSDRIREVLEVESIPPDDKRDPHVLYIVKDGVPERDQHLGAFMHRWSSLERTLLLLLSHLTDDGYQTAEVLFYSANSIKSQTDMITGLIALQHPCPSSKHLGHLSLFVNGGFGSSGFDVKPLGVDGSSGGF